jgi:hypothetical protein
MSTVLSQISKMNDSKELTAVVQAALARRKAVNASRREANAAAQVARTEKQLAALNERREKLAARLGK